MSKRAEYLDIYLEGWEALDAEKVVSSLDDSFQYVDPAMPVPITKDRMAAYMARWGERTKALGGTGEVALSNTVTRDEDGVLLSWTWWLFAGTEVQGAALIKAGDSGVLLEKIAYHKAP